MLLGQHGRGEGAGAETGGSLDACGTAQHVEQQRDSALQQGGREVVL